MPSGSNGVDSMGSCIMAVENAACVHFILYVFISGIKLFFIETAMLGI